MVPAGNKAKSLLSISNTTITIHHQLTAEAQYSINLSSSIENLKNLFKPAYNESSSFLFVNFTKIYQFKAKNSEIKKYLVFINYLRTFSIQ